MTPERLRAIVSIDVERDWVSPASGELMGVRFCLTKVSGRVLTLAYRPAGGVVRGHTKPVMPSQIQWQCPDLGLHTGWFWEGRAVVVSSDRNVVNESDKAIVENKDMLLS